MDWGSPGMLARELSNTHAAAFCVRVLKKAIQLRGAPEIANTDQDIQFTSLEFTGVLLAHRVNVSMNGKGHCLHNVFGERLWRSVNYEDVYLKAYANVLDAEHSLSTYFYNER